jgi:hypothetical protein
MNTALLKLANRDRRGTWQWTVPGYSNGVKWLPAELTRPGWGAQLCWPHRDDKGECTRSVDLDRHRKLAKQEIKNLLAICNKD